MAVMTKIGTALEEEAEDKFEPSLEAAQGSIASAAAQNDIFVTKKQVAELYAGKCDSFYQLKIIFVICIGV